MSPSGAPFDTISGRRRQRGALASRQEAPLTSKRRNELAIDLALQGGGSHGAFTWGVLDRLLEERWLRIDGISGPRPAP
jgi:NTE family protein